MTRINMDEDRVVAVGEWAQVIVEGERLRLEMGYADNPDQHEYCFSLTPEAAIELALKLSDKAYTARGVDVQRIAIVINPEIQGEPEEEKPETLPS